MAKLKKSLMLFSLAIFSLFGLVFAGCNDAYEKVDIELEQTQVFLATTSTATLNEEEIVSAKISGVKSKSISKKLTFISDRPEVVRVEDVEYADDTTSAKLVAVGGGSAIVYVISEGNVRKQISVDVEQEATSIGVYGSYAPIILRGQDEFTFDETQIFYNPASVTSELVDIELWRVNENGAPVRLEKENAKVLTSEDIEKLTSSNYVFKIIKTSTKDSQNPIVAWENVVVKDSLDENSIQLQSENLEESTFRLSTSDLGDELLLPSTTSFITKYNGSLDLSNFEVKIKNNNPELFDISTEYTNENGNLERAIHAIKRGVGSFEVQIYYQGYELSKISKTYTVEIEEYPASFNSLFDGKIQLDNNYNIYSKSENYNGLNLGFNVIPSIEDVETTLRLEINYGDFAFLLKDDGSTNKVGGVVFNQVGSNFVAEISSQNAITLFASAYAQINEIIEIKVSIIKAEKEGQILFENKEFGTQTLQLVISVPVQDIKLSIGDGDNKTLITETEKNNLENANQLKYGNGTFFIDVATIPEDASLVDVEILTIYSSGFGDNADQNIVLDTFFNSTSNQIRIRVKDYGTFQICVKNKFIEKYYSFVVYDVIKQFKIDFEKAILDDNCFFDEQSGLFYLAKGEQIKLPIILDKKGVGEQYLTSTTDDNLVCGFSDDLNSVYLGDNHSLSFVPNNQVYAVSFEIKGYDFRLINTVRFVIYEPINQSHLSFKNESGEIVESVDLDFAGDVGYFGNSSVTLKLDAGTEENVEFSFASSSKAFGEITYVSGSNEITFTANSWSGNSDHASVIIVGEATQFGRTYSARIVINISRKPEATGIVFLEDDFVYTESSKNISLSTMVAPTLASGEPVLYVLTAQEKVAGESYYNVLATTLYGAVNETEFALSNTNLSINAPGKYKVWAFYQNSISENILETLSEETINTAVCTFKDIIFADGSEENPYRIYNASDFEKLDGSSAYFELVNNIDLNGRNQALNSFGGYLNGNGFEVYNFNIQSSVEENLGLFKTVDGTISNLKVRGTVSQGKLSNSNTGILAGTLTVKLDNISILGSKISFYETGNQTGFVSVYAGGIAGRIVGGESASSQIVDCKVENFLVENKAEAIIGGIVGYCENANLSGRYIGAYEIIGEQGENVSISVVAGSHYQNASLTVNKTNNSKFSTVNGKLFYTASKDETFVLEDLFNVGSVAQLMPGEIDCAVDFDISYNNKILTFENGSFKVINFGVCEFEFTSTKDSTVNKRINVFFIPSGLSVTVSESALTLYSGEEKEISAWASVSNLNDYYISFEVNNTLFIGNFIDGTLTGHISLHGTTNGSITFIIYAKFENEDIEIARKTVDVLINESATAISATISKAQFNPTESILISIDIEKNVGENDNVYIGTNKSSLAEIDFNSSYSGLKFFETGIANEYRVFVDEQSFSYGQFTLYFAPSSNTNLICELTFTIIRPTVSLIEIDQYVQIGGSKDGKLSLNNSEIDNRNININESSLFGIYISPYIADVQYVEVLSNFLQFEYYVLNADETFDVGSDINIAGGIKINSNPFNNGWLYIRAILGNVSVGTNVTLTVNVNFLNANNELQVKSKTITLQAQNRATLKLVTENSMVAQGCDITAKLFFGNEPLIGSQFESAVSTLSFVGDENSGDGARLMVVATNPLTGEITFRAKNSLGNCQITVDYTKTTYGITKTYVAILNIRIVDVIISGFEYYLNFGTLNEQKIDSALEVTAYNNFNVGVRFVGQWRQDYNLLIKELEQKINDFNVMSSGEQSTLFVDENGFGLTQGENYAYFKANGTTVVNEIEMLKLLPIKQTQQTFISFRLNALYSDNEFYIVANDENNFGINGNSLSTIAGAEKTQILGSLPVVIKQNSSEDCPLPISSMQELIDNNVVDANLILTNDIYVYDWAPIDAQFKTLDGNGYKIVLYSTAFLNYLDTVELTNLLNIGLFSSISESSMIKNLTIGLYSNQTSYEDINGNTIDVAGGLKISINREINSETEINFGTLAAQNYGIITNCSVVYVDTPIQSETDIYDDILFNPSLSKTSSNLDAWGVVGGLIAQNYAYITNSSVEVDISIGTTVKAVTGDYILAGLVGNNNNSAVISSSYVQSSSIYNHSENTEGGEVATAGFVANNETDATIIYSYIHGGFNYNKISTNDEIDADDYIRSNYKQIKTSVGSIAGFVFQNQGKISNSFANVDLYQISTTTTSGFALINEGIIEMSYSASHLAEERGNNTYSFIKESLGLIQNCYFLDDGFSINPENSGAIALTAQEFINSNSFVGFGFRTDYSEDNAIWEMPTNFIYKSVSAGTEGAIVAHVTHVGENKGDYGRTESGTYYYRGENNGTFNINLGQATDGNIWVIKLDATTPNLVVPNITTSSRRLLIGAVNENGEFINGSDIDKEDLKIENYYYSYLDTSSTNDEQKFFDLGTINNPILIRDVYDFNTLLINGSTTYDKWGNDYYYRMVADIEFSEDTILTPNTTNSTFYGVLDGNGMSVQNVKLNINYSNIVVDPNSINESLGLFGIIDGTAGVKRAGITQKTIAGAGVRALDITISELYANTYVYVGSLAGVVKNASVYSISVSQFGNSQVIGYGRNIIGGVVGLVVGASDIYNVSSNISLFSTYIQDGSLMLTDSALKGSDLDAMTINTDRYKTKVDSEFYVGQSYMLSDLRTSYVGGTIGVLDTFYKQDSATQRVRTESLFVDPNTNNNLILSGGIVGGSVGFVGDYSVLRDAKLNLANASEATNLARDISGGLVGENRGVVDGAHIVYSSQFFETQLGFAHKNNTAIITGGVVGLNDGGSVVNSFETNNITINGNYFTNSNAYVMGGVVGLNLSTSGRVARVENCFNTTNITSAKEKVAVGGVVGFNAIVGDFESNIISTYNTGKLTATKLSSSVGGIVGKTWGGVTKISQSFTAGKLTVGMDSFVGGFVGWSKNLTLENAFAINNASKGNESVAGGAVGYNDGVGTLNITNAYFAGSTLDEETNVLFGTAFGQTNLTNTSVIVEMIGNNVNLHEGQITAGQINPSSFMLLNDDFDGVSTWKTDGNIPYLNFETYLDFIDAIKNSETSLTNLTAFNKNSPPILTGNTNYLLTENIELNAPIDATDWSGMLLGNGFSVTLANGTSMFKNGLGNGARISGLKLVVPSNVVVDKNFGFIVGESSSELTLSSIEISTCKITASASNISVGSLIGLAGGTDKVLIVNCSSEASIADGSGLSQTKLGGFVGSANCDVEIVNSYVAGHLTVSSENAYAGGFVGFADSLINISKSFFVGQINNPFEEGSVATDYQAYEAPENYSFDQAKLGYFIGYALNNEIVNSFVGADTTLVDATDSTQVELALANGNTRIKNSYIYAGINQLRYWNETGEVVTAESWLEVKQNFADNTDWNNNVVPLVSVQSWAGLQEIIANTNSPLKETEVSALSDLSGVGIYKLTNNLTVNSSIDASEFNGIVNGNNKVITLSVPLFSELGEAIISNLTFEGSIESSGDVGAVIGYATNSICLVNCTM